MKYEFLKATQHNGMTHEIGSQADIPENQALHWLIVKRIKPVVEAKASKQTKSKK